VPPITRKTEIEPVDGTPVKRMFWSIVSDYNLKTGLCELVDNAIDTWMVAGSKNPLKVALTLDVERQLISVTDDAGGVKREDLRLLVAPGGSRNDPRAEIIGVFGVGSKRAGIALAEHVVIKTRFLDEGSCELDITPEWLASDEWELPAYAIPNIDPGTTQVDMSHLRESFTKADIDGLRTHLGETYGWFLQNGCCIELDGDLVVPRTFEAWAFPPEFPPRSVSFDLNIEKYGKFAVTMTGGLITDRIPEADNYGVYFYCNHRLIAKEIRTRDVGYFVSTQAGVPHPDASLCRVIVWLQGPARPMPWNSSKSGINFGHPVFQAVRPGLIDLARHYSSLSRRLKDDWDHKVFRYETGEIEKVQGADATEGKRLILPSLPPVQKPRSEKYKSINKVQIRHKPWTLGLIEAMAAVDIIERQRLETKNRIALILLDSNFEIALKEFIVHRHDLFPPTQYNDSTIRRLFSNRSDVIKVVTDNINIPATLIDAANHYYLMRNKLIHERATVGVTDSDVANYRSTIERLLALLFDLEFAT
jgi:Histidine kinase-, DNA gyrase B-, and HSP90-like ATPase